ncbi:site-specific DNA-methyltransferase [Candidatus Pacearchaeota archaeon]|nr:site-specific DNA-methyltransferase [Candidatus Pacearchaeota archaeon]
MSHYHESDLGKIYHGDNIKVLKTLKSDSVDLMVTDPPYGYGFLGKDWDKAIPPVELWKECLRVMKPGAFAFVMSAPRQDVMARMIINLEDAGFVTNFSSVYWTYASGFPKAVNISKAIDKRLGVEREVVGVSSSPNSKNGGYEGDRYSIKRKTKFGDVQDQPSLTIPSSPEAKAFAGAFGGCQMKPAVEVVLTVMKPMDEKTFIDQALKNGKGVTWLGKGTIPYVSDKDRESSEIGFEHPYMSENANEGWKRPCHENYENWDPNEKGRFPANLLVSDDVLNDGKVRASGEMKAGTVRQNRSGYTGAMPSEVAKDTPADAGSFSRYFDLDRWFDEKMKNLPPEVKRTFPFLIVAKPAKSEKNKGLERLSIENDHPTVKPVRLKSYLITIGGRPGDVVLDPCVGSGTTPTACEMLGYKYVAIDDDKHSCDIAAARVADEGKQKKLFVG